MSKLFYQPGAQGTELKVLDDPQVLVQSDVETQRDAFALLRAQGEELRTLLAQSTVPGVGGPYPSLAAFDQAVDDEWARLSDIADYFDYGNRVESITVRDGMWVTPSSVESFVGGENVGEEVGLSVDGTNGTWWGTTHGAPSVIYKIQDYKKKFSKIRLRTTSGDLRAQLQSVNVRLAVSLGSIDDPERLCGTFDFTYVDDNWIEISLPSPKTGVYLKLDGFASLHVASGGEDFRVREVGLFAITQNHDK